MVIKLKDNVLPATGLKIDIRNGVFDLNEFLSKAKTWFFRKQYDYAEKKHSDKDLPQGHEVNIICVNDRKVSDYIKFHIDMDLFITDMKKTKVDGRTFEKGNFEARFFAWLELDYKKKWQSRPFANFLLHVYNNYIIKKQIQDYEDKLYDEVMELFSKLKKVLGTYH